MKGCGRFLLKQKARKHTKYAWLAEVISLNAQDG